MKSAAPSDAALSRPPAPAKSGSYQALDASKIIKTAEALQLRVAERFPGSSLSRIAEELVAVGSTTAETAAALARPNAGLRVLAGIAIVGVLGLFVATLLVLIKGQVAPFSSFADYLQGVDAAVNELVFLGVAIFFLFTIEGRFKRRRALRALHILRSMSHIIDMHQLTKDPERLTDLHRDTVSSPSRSMTAFELTRYLDYCSEMLAVISKLAALHVQESSDPVTLSAVNDIEDLTQGLSRKIWQKIMILDRIIAPHCE